MKKNLIKKKLIIVVLLVCTLIAIGILILLKRPNLFLLKRPVYSASVSVEMGNPTNDKMNPCDGMGLCNVDISGASSKASSSYAIDATFTHEENSQLITLSFKMNDLRIHEPRQVPLVSNPLHKYKFKNEFEINSLLTKLHIIGLTKIPKDALGEVIIDSSNPSDPIVFITLGLK